MVNAAKLASAEGYIDNLDNLKNDRVYIFSGTEDTVVKTGVTDSTFDFYEELVSNPKQIFYDKSIPAGHAFITKNPADNDCSANSSPNINYCNLQQAFEIFEHIYGPQNPPSPTDSSLLKHLYKFDQKEFIPKNRTGHILLNTFSMEDSGYVYIPEVCEEYSGECKVHVALHGCGQGASKLGKQYIIDTGYMEAADTNKTIILFPQVKSIPGLNPKGCWDFWGYTTSTLLDPYSYQGGIALC